MSKIPRFAHKFVLVVIILMMTISSMKSYTASAQGPDGGRVPSTPNVPEILPSVPLQNPGVGANAIPLGTNLLKDPSFEASYGSNQYWTQDSTCCGTPLYTADGGAPNGSPRTGSIWGWFGGTPEYEVAYVNQPATFPKCGAVLVFFLWIGQADPGSGADDYFEARVDGNIVFHTDATQASAYPIYTFEEIDVSQYADGGVHYIEFFSFTDGQIVSFNLDDVALYPTVNPSRGCASVTVEIAGQATYYGIPPGTGERVSYVGVDNGPVYLLSSDPFVASERVAYFNGTKWTSFSEMMGLPWNLVSTSYTYTFPIYNNVDINTQLRFANVGSANTTVTVRIGGVVKGTYNLGPDQGRRVSYAGLNSGPVVIQSSGGVPIIASERAAYYNSSISKWTSFSEMMGLPASQLSTAYLFPWFNNVALNSQLRVGNVGTASTNVTVRVGGVLKGTYPLARNAVLRVAYPVDSGPVLIQSSGGVPIVASLRVGYTPDNGATWPDVSEMMGLPTSSLSTSYTIPWYNNVDINSQLRFGNVGNASTTVTVIIGGAVKGTYNLGANQSHRVSYAGLNSGPVVIQSSGGVPIIASERVAYLNPQNNKWTSFSEMMGLPASQLTTFYVFPWYNNVDLNTQLRFGVP